MENRVTIVTGAASGIGRALAREQSRRGDIVVLVDRDEAAVGTAAGELCATGAIAVAATADITQPDALLPAVATAGDLGRLTTACLNAGVTTTGTMVWETPPDLLDLMLAVNLRGLFESIRSVVPAMLSHGEPARILVTASMAGLVTSPTSAAYSASKAGAIAVAGALRSELAHAAPQISVTILAPGMVSTNLMNTSAAQHRAAAMAPELVQGAHQALNTLGEDPDEVARLALDDLSAGRYWSLPPAGDPFVEQLRGELDELRRLL